MVLILGVVLILAVGSVAFYVLRGSEPEKARPTEEDFFAARSEDCFFTDPEACLYDFAEVLRLATRDPDRFQILEVPSPSMQPTLFDGDRIVVNKLSYRLHEVNRGDVVVFRRSDPDLEGINNLIKRVVALPGETVEVLDGKVYVNGDMLIEPYLALATRNSTGGFPMLPPGCIGDRDSINRCTVPNDHVFVMGDNRRNSKDSRFFGPVAESELVGRVFLAIGPDGSDTRLDEVGSVLYPRG